LANFTNHFREGFPLRPFTYWRTQAGVTPKRLAISWIESFPLTIISSRRPPMARSSQTTGVREELERNAGKAPMEGTTVKTGASEESESPSSMAELDEVSWSELGVCIFRGGAVFGPDC
jgi:hypothetical protein